MEIVRNDDRSHLVTIGTLSANTVFLRGDDVCMKTDGELDYVNMGTGITYFASREAKPDKIFKSATLTVT